MKIFSRILPALLIIALPLAVGAQAGNFNEATSFLGGLINFINRTLIPLLFAIAFLVFLWGVFTVFILGASDDEKRKDGKNLVFYAVMGFVVMISLWGIVNLLASSFGLREQGPEALPVVPGLR